MRFRSSSPPSRAVHLSLSERLKSSSHLSASSFFHRHISSSFLCYLQRRHIPPSFLPSSSHLFVFPLKSSSRLDSHCSSFALASSRFPKIEGMAYQFPKRTLEEGAETHIDKINNTCRRTIFETGELFPFISHTGNNDVVDNVEFIREDEKIDERVGHIVALMNAKQDWNRFAWDVEDFPRNVELSDSEEDVEVEDVTEELSVVAEEPTVVAEEPQLLQRNRLLLQKGESISLLIQVSSLKRNNCFVNRRLSITVVSPEDMSQFTGPSHTEGKTRASEIPGPSHTKRKDQDKSSQSPDPSAAKEKGKGKAAESLPPPTVHHSLSQ
ncbi:hypothetical protein YC2023_088803 [Brassica napus]